MPGTTGYPHAVSCSCTTPTVEATVAECVPLAEAVVSRGDGPAVMERLRSAAQECVFYEADPAGGGRGRCSEYAVRPAICRLFGFAAVRRKDGSAELSACRVMRVSDPAGVTAACEGVRDGRLAAPVMADWSARVAAASDLSAEETSRMLPINEAFSHAIQRELMLAHYRSMAASEAEAAFQVPEGMSPQGQGSQPVGSDVGASLAVPVEAVQRPPQVVAPPDAEAVTVC